MLRRPPRPPLPPIAHDVLREWRMLDAIKDTPARSPRTLLACDDERVIGAPFYVMEYCVGTVITSEIPEPLDTPEERRRMGSTWWTRSPRCTRSTGAPAGSRASASRPATWSASCAVHRPVGAQQDSRASARAGAARLARGEHAGVAADATIVHGDYRLGNTMVADDPPARMIAIFDWELSTIGDPLADLGYMTVTWVGARRPRRHDVQLAVGRHAARRAFPTRDELIAHYEERTGRSMSDLRWYQTLALWKAAVFMEGNYKRSLAGTTDDPYLKLFDEGVPVLAEAAYEIEPWPAPTTGALTGLLVDYGGVLTTNVWDSLSRVLRRGGPRPRAR